MANGQFKKDERGNVYTSPYIIEDVADLNAVRNFYTKDSTTKYNFKLDCHLDFKESDFENWTPIPNFLGTFDGNFNCIYNLKIKDKTLDDVGLFSNIKEGSTICNLALMNVDIEARDNVGAIIGNVNKDSINISTCYVHGSIKGNDNVGAIVGRNLSRQNNFIKQCITECDVVGHENIGGLAGSFTSFNKTKPCNIVHNFAFGTVNGENFISTNATVGLNDDYSVYGHNYFDKDRIPNYYPDEKAEGYEKKYFFNRNNFEELLTDYYTKDNHNLGLWRFSNKNYVGFNWLFNIYSVFRIDGELYSYNSGHGDFVKIEDVPEKLTFNFFYQHGIKNVGVITSSEIRNAMNGKNITVLSACESGTGKYKPNVTANIKTDKIRSSCSVDLFTIEQSNTLEFDSFEDMGKKYSVTTVEKKEKENLPLSIIAENETEREKPNVKILVKSDKKEAIPDDAEFSIQVTDNTQQSEKSALNDKRHIEIHASKQHELRDFNMSISAENNNKHIDPHQKLRIVKDDRELAQKIKTNLTYTLYNTVSQQTRGVNVVATGKNKSRYLLSVNNGQSWLTYNKEKNNWVSANLANVHDEGVTVEDLKSRAIMNSLPTNYASKLKIASAISADAFNSTFNIRDINITFEENEGPEVLNAGTMSDNDYVTITGTLNDKENDTVSYRILTKHQLEPDYHQIYPANKNGWLAKKNGYKFTEKFPLGNFKNGANVVKIETKDSRGELAEKLINFTLITGTPTVKINSQNQFYANVSLAHTLGRKVRFRIYINGEQKAPVKEGAWSEWKDVSDGEYTFDYTWNTEDVLNGLPNEIRFEVEDDLQTIVNEQFSVIGEYKSLLFKDTNGFYYSTDTGDILQQLDFGTIVGGVLSDAYPVIIENKTGLAMNDVIIYPDALTQEDKTKILLSYDKDFVASNETITVKNYDTYGVVNKIDKYENAIKVPYVLENNDTYTFYVRIDSEVDANSYKNKTFRVLATGTPVDTKLITTILPKTDYEENYINSTVLDDGEGLFDIEINDMADKYTLNGSSIYVTGDTVFKWMSGRMTEEKFMARPVTDQEMTEALTRIKTQNEDFTPYSIAWLDDFFVKNYGDTVVNLVQAGKLSFKRRLRSPKYYDGHVSYEHSGKPAMSVSKYGIREK